MELIRIFCASISDEQKGDPNFGTDKNFLGPKRVDFRPCKTGGGILIIYVNKCSVQFVFRREVLRESNPGPGKTSYDIYHLSQLFPSSTQNCFG